MMVQGSGSVSRGTSGPLYRTTVVVHVGLALGPTLFGAAVWWLSRQGAVPAMALREATPLIYAWLAALTALVVGAAKVWTARVEPLEGAVRSGQGGPPPESVLAMLLPVWVMLEAPALFGIILFMLTGAPLLLAAALLFLWSSLWLTRPREEWFRR
jgi:hypothetical protein